MHRMKFLPLLIAAVACQPARTQLTEEARAEVTGAISTLNTEYWDAWRAADWDRGMTYYLDSPDFVWAAGGTVYYGLKTLEDSKPRFANVAKQAFNFRDTRVVVLAPDAASVVATGTWTQTDSTGVTGPAREFAWTSVWVLRDGSWKIQLVHMSYPSPLPGAM